VKEGTFERGVPCGNPSARTQLFAADRRTSHGSKKEETLRHPMEVPEKKQKEAPYNSYRPPEVFNILMEFFIVLW